MRKFLLSILLLWGGIISAQDTINYLVITEYRGDNTNRCYLELTNMGDKAVQLNQFEIGSWGGGSTLDMATGVTNENGYRIPVDKLLQPGESYVFAAVKEYGPRKFAQGLENFPEKETQDEMWKYADFHVHLPEPFDDGTDIVTENFYQPFSEQWGPGMNGFFIEQHFPNGDSMVVDQVNGMFSGENGTNPNRTTGIGYDVAGVTLGTATCYLIRKFSVKHGNLDFNNARGVGLDDSEWIPIPHFGQAWRAPMWTVGNHGNFVLDANTLVSDEIDVDFANKTLTVPWGVQRGDDIMNYFEQKPGIGWDYKMGADADSLTHAAQTGDRLDIYVCGDNFNLATFDIVVMEPAANANMVVPRTNEDPLGNWRGEIESGYWAWPRVTKHEDGNDSIWGVRGGIPYATRVDSLLERLDKPSNAEWEIVYAGGVQKPDLSNGDKLKVTAQDGSIKEYYISVLDYRANDDANLSAITWPDIPEFYKGIFGWIGDTIPGFSSQVYNYNVEVPLLAEGIPALIATKSDVNAKVEVSRAGSLSGSVGDRTISFKVTAEDDSTVNNYSVILSKEKNPLNVQPYFAEPFISEVINNVYWSNDGYLEICNPGNQPLDLSDYMIVSMNNPDPSSVIEIDHATTYIDRYEKYIPGYKWASTEGEWVVEPYVAQADLSVNSVLLPGDVFVMGAVRGSQCGRFPNWPDILQLDVQFMNNPTDCYNFVNQWGEEVSGRGTVANKFRDAHIFLFKILNDSIKKGQKAATDPNDFELVDVFGMGENTGWLLGGVACGACPDMRRKPNIYKGNPVVGESMGNNIQEELEWNNYNHDYWAAQGYGWPGRMLNLITDLGKHYFDPPTHYISTVGSLVYKISEGYSMNEQIKGVSSGTTVSNFLANIIKANEGQTLTLNSGSDGSELGMDAVLNLNDILTVLSADSTNTSKYILDVSEEGLSSNAVLTSNSYDITVDVEPKSAEDTQSAGSGTIKGFEYGTQLKTVINNLIVPAGAAMTIIDSKGAYVPLTRLNMDTVYVAVTVNAETYLQVVAENGVTTIVYQVMPDVTESDAFVTSDVYAVSQNNMLIEFVERGTNVQSFLANLSASYGATMKLVDKKGFERVDGQVADDDKVVVTSANGDKTVAYHISKLATQYSPAGIYLAYILSKTYMIDQIDYVIDGASSESSVTEFYSKITTSMGATAMVVDKDGVEKTSGNIAGSDMVKVTSADGRIVVTYTFGQVVSSNAMEVKDIAFYPNPTNGRLNVTGVAKGQRIQVYNSVGAVIIDINVESSHEILNIDDHPAGMYLIVVSNKEKLLGKYKAIKY